MESSVFHPADLSEKVFTFLSTSNTPSVKLSSQERDLNLTAMTVCLRYHSVLTRSQSLFSLATPSHDNDLLLYKPATGAYRLHVGGTALDIDYLEENNNDWNSVCWTWDSGFGQTGVVAQRQA
ncbi:Serum amyloid P-component [Merluccius polli]|uniref:Serum amyloid P-component n=1 Tax=Merluccius polli TaxID=89951 RepID=A0AA47MM00_MERPO|nr:Serum amyloid P-component [Merluccius polli]